MPQVIIDEKGCRDCALCVEVCPTEVLVRSDARQLAEVARTDDCIGCTSCVYICPSRCISVTDFVGQRPFHRIEANRALVSRFLQQKPPSAELGEGDYQEAIGDIRVRLKALADAVTETMGRGQKAVGRAAGAQAAAHLPEMYEESELGPVLERLRRRFAGSFEFEAKVEEGDRQITLRFPACAFRHAVTSQGDVVGKAVLCDLFHEYWAGLLGAFSNRSFAVTMLDTERECTMRLAVRT
jgi:2-oxoglutarate ferredoxin oxidoreductase subunit delta